MNRALLFVIAAAACAPPPPAPPDDVPPPTPSFTCGDTIDGLAPFVGPGRVLMLGEIHGTNEIPAFAGEVACQAAKKGATHLGLELPDSLQPNVDAFLASDDGDTALLFEGTTYWAAFHDGRTSVAMVALLEQMRALRRDGADVEVFLFDGDPGDDRDTAMAGRVLDRRHAFTDAMIVTLSGNIHSRAIVGISFDPDLVPMGFHIAAEVDDLATLNCAYEDGTAWISTSEGLGVHDLDGTLATGPVGTIDATPTSDGAHDGVFFVGPLSAALPAVP